MSDRGLSFALDGGRAGRRGLAGGGQPDRVAAGVRSASHVSSESASHTRPKPAHRSGGIASWKYRMPRRNWKTGARYWSSPSVESGTRIAAAPKQTSGAAVTTPVAASSAAWPTPSVPNVASPCAPSHTR